MKRKCSRCGESEAACHCDPGEQDLFDCTNCGGDGIAPLDKE
jgi:hypothetical protein